jgi:hypothetical protein
LLECLCVRVRVRVLVLVLVLASLRPCVLACLLA